MEMFYSKAVALLNDLDNVQKVIAEKYQTSVELLKFNVPKGNLKNPRIKK